MSRVTKRQGCSGLKDLASTLGPSLGESSSGRRLIRRVLSQVPGRTWEGKEELLEAVTALCAAGKSSAVTLEPFVWGGDEATDGGLPSSCSSRGVKRSRSSEPLGHEDEEEEDEDEQEEEEGEESASAGISQEDGASASSGAATESAGAKGGGESDNGSASDDNNDATNNADEADGPAFEYEDKLGDIIEAPAPAVPAPAEAAQLASVQAPHDPQSSGEPRKDAALEAGLASLDMEDDSPVPFGEVVSLMLSQLRR